MAEKSIDFSNCIFCNSDEGKLVQPTLNKKNKSLAGYDYIQKFSETDKPHSKLVMLKSISQNVPISRFLEENNAVYHKKCYDSLRRPKKLNNNDDVAVTEAVAVSSSIDKERRSNSRPGEKVLACFICKKKDSPENLHLVSTLNLNDKIEKIASDLIEFFKHDNQPYPPALSLNGNMRFTKKSDIINSFEVVAEDPTNFLKNCTTFVAEGAVEVQIRRPNTQKTFGEYSKIVFNGFIRDKLSQFERIDIIWDDYRVPSIKEATRNSRGKGIRQKVEDNTKLPKNWGNFLQVNENKQELFAFLSKSIFEDQAVSQSYTTILSTLKENVLCNKPSFYKKGLEPCNHEESDTRLMVHLKDIVADGHKNIVMKTVDSDVVVLAVSTFARSIQEGIAIDKLYIAFGTSKKFR